MTGESIPGQGGPDRIAPAPPPPVLARSENNPAPEQQKRVDLLKSVQQAVSVESVFRVAQKNYDTTMPFDPKEPPVSEAEALQAVTDSGKKITENVTNQQKSSWAAFDKYQTENKTKWKVENLAGETEWDSLNAEQKQSVRIQAWSDNQANMYLEALNKDETALDAAKLLKINATSKEEFTQSLKDSFYVTFFGHDETGNAADTGTKIIDALTQDRPTLDVLQNRVKSLSGFLSGTLGEKAAKDALEIAANLKVIATNSEYKAVFSTDFINDKEVWEKAKLGYNQDLQLDDNRKVQEDDGLQYLNGAKVIEPGVQGTTDQKKDSHHSNITPESSEYEAAERELENAYIMLKQSLYGILENPSTTQKEFDDILEAYGIKMVDTTAQEQNNIRNVHRLDIDYLRTIDGQRVSLNLERVNNTLKQYLFKETIGHDLKESEVIELVNNLDNSVVKHISKKLGTIDSQLDSENKVRDITSYSEPQLLALIEKITPALFHNDNNYQAAREHLLDTFSRYKENQRDASDVYLAFASLSNFADAEPSEV